MEHMDQNPREGAGHHLDGPLADEGTSSWAFTGAVVLLGAGAFAVFIALLVARLACDTPGSQACERQSLATLQVYVAAAGLVPLGLVALAAWRGRTRSAWRWLIVALLVYATWAVLNDAAVHGWDDLVLLP